MKKRLPKKLELSRETLRSFAAPRMGEVAGGATVATCPAMCGSYDSCLQTCTCSCTCTSPIVCAT